MSAALRRLVGESRHLGEHYRFFALTETSVTSCATSLSHCLRLFCISTLPTPKYHSCDAVRELKNSFHKLFKTFFEKTYARSLAGTQLFAKIDKHENQNGGTYCLKLFITHSYNLWHFNAFCWMKDQST